MPGVSPSDDDLLERVRAAISRVDLDRGFEHEATDDPPADLWSRIEASLSDEPLHQPTGAGTVVEYRIDADDKIVSTGGAWSDFAAANEAPELSRTATGRLLWDGIAPGPLRDLWQRAVAAVRSSGITATLPFRCDGPGARRWFEMTLSPGPDHSVTFRSRLVFEMERPHIELLRQSEIDEIDVVVQVCAWCAEARDGDDWRPIEELLVTARVLEASAPSVDYEFCPRCDATVRTGLLHSTAPATSTTGSEAAAADMAT